MGASSGLPDNIPTLVRATASTATLAATNGGTSTRITIGGQQYRLTTALTLDITTTGLGGLDTGAFGTAHQLYYVYAVANSSGVVGLVASLTTPTTGPSGFTTRFKLVGALYASDAAATIGNLVSHAGVAETGWFSFNPSLNNVTLGTGAVSLWFWRRVGSDLIMNGSFVLGTGGLLTGNMLLSLPNGFALDQTVINGDTAGTWAYISSEIAALDVSANTRFAALLLENSGSATAFSPRPLTGTDATFNATVPFTWAVSDQFKMWGKFPISGWKATLL